MRLTSRLAICVCVALLGACAGPRQDVERRYFWPPLGDDPKIEYVGYFQSDYDVKKVKVGLVEEAVFGREKPVYLFSQPFDVFSNGTDRIIVSEPAAGFVKVIDYQKGDIDYLKDRKGNRKLFKQPLGLTADVSGQIYVVDSIEKTIYIFSSKLHLIDEWELEELERPVSIAIDVARQRAYVADPGQHKIVILSFPEGKYQRTIGQRGSEAADFNFPLDVDLDRDGNVYVLDSLNARVKVFSPDGAFLRSFGERGTALGSFQLPKGLAVSPSGLVYVTDSMAHRLIVFDLQGQHLLTIGGRFAVSEGTIYPGGMYLPQGVDADKNDGIWIVDTLNRIVHRYQYLTDAYLQLHPILPGQAVIPTELQKFKDSAQ